LLAEGDAALWMQRMCPKRVGGCNPLLKVFLSLLYGEVMWRHDYATCKPNDEFVTTTVHKGEPS